jgi:hypothetical protein
LKAYEVVCTTTKNCGRIYSAGTGNSTLFKHLKTCHAVAYNQLQNNKNNNNNNNIHNNDHNKANHNTNILTATPNGTATDTNDCITNYITNTTPTLTCNPTIKELFRHQNNTQLPNLIAQAFAINSLPSSLIDEPNFRNMLEAIRHV